MKRRCNRRNVSSKKEGNMRSKRKDEQQHTVLKYVEKKQNQKMNIPFGIGGFPIFLMSIK